MLLAAMSFKDETALVRFKLCVMECCDVEVRDIIKENKK